MKIKILCLYITFIITILFCGCEESSDVKHTSVSTPFQISENIINNKVNSSEVDKITEKVNATNMFDVFDSKEANLFEDEKIQIVELRGEYFDIEFRNHTKYTKLIIKDYLSNEIIVEKDIAESTGVPSLFIGDLNGDKFDDIMITVPDGSIKPESFYKVFTFDNKDIKEISIDILKSDINFEYYFKDSYKTMIVQSQILNTSYSVTISNELTDLYKKDKDVSPIVKSELEPIDFDNDGVYELRNDLWIYNNVVVKAFIAAFNMDYKYIDGNWRPIELKLIE